MNVYNHKKRNFSSGIHFIGILLIVLGGVISISSVIISLLPPFDSMLPLSFCLIAIGLVITLSFGGTEINFAQNIFRNYSVICGFQIGEWSTLPTIRKIKVKSAAFQSTNSKNGISPTLSGTVKEFKVLLYSEASTPYLSFVFSKKEKALKTAELLAHNLRLKVEVED